MRFLRPGSSGVFSRDSEKVRNIELGGRSGFQGTPMPLIRDFREEKQLLLDRALARPP